jgi:hypothetical protein
VKAAVLRHELDLTLNPHGANATDPLSAIPRAMDESRASNITGDHYD